MSPRDRFAILPSGEIRINDRPLIDLVREVELPFAQEKYNEWIASGEDPSKVDLIAGDYSYLPPWMVMFPSKHLLDEPYRIAEEGFILKPEDSRIGKTTILGCTCGILECWFLLARISLTETTVTWSDFQQFHRDWWTYNLGSFIFARQDYELQLRGTF